MSRKFPDDYGPALSAQDMAEIFGKSVPRIYALAGEGAFDAMENKPSIGARSWSRDRVVKYFAGELRGLTPVRKKTA